MSSLLVFAIGCSLSQVLLSLALLVRQVPWGLTERLFGVFMVAVLGYLLTPILQDTPLSLLAKTVQTAAPGVFWLLSSSVFIDRFQLRAWQLGLVKFTVFAPLLGYLSRSTSVQLTFVELPQMLEFVMLALVFWIVIRYWSTDLVESRRRLRLWFVVLNGSYLFLVILSRQILFPEAEWLYLLEYLPPAILLLAVNVSLLQYREGLLFFVRDAPASPIAIDTVTKSPAERSAVDPELVARLQRHMEEACPWREMGLSIGQLATQLDVPEYRLRRAVNGSLGYRNFSDFLSSYRVRETARRLIDPKDKHLPVLTIAMEAGFRSLSSFNKAFKESQGQTPTAWRKFHGSAQESAKR